MNPKYDIYEEIDRYLNEELSEAELAQFNEKLSRDAEFKSIVEAQKIANEVIIDQEMIKLKERMSKDMNPDNNGSSHWGKIILFSAVVTSATLYSYINYNKSDSSEVKENAAPVSSAQTIAEGDRSQKDQATTSIEQPVVAKKTTPTSAHTSDVAPVTTQNSTEVVPNVEQVISHKELATASITQESKAPEIKTIVPVVEQTAKINCETISITATIKVDYGFDDDGEATIIINPSSVKGGTAPYAYALERAAFGTDNRFDGIKDGTYHVRIKDHNNCVSEIKKEIIIKTPAKEIDEAFTPSHGERWKFPVKDNADATLTIFNKAGSTVYSTHISGGYPSEWNGLSNSGVELESANYYFVIQYSAQEVVKGHISITR